MATTMTDPELTCHELVELVTGDLEDAMAASDRQRLEQHLAACGRCRRYLDQMKHTIQTVGQLHDEAIAPAARDDLLKVFRTWRPIRWGPGVRGAGTCTPSRGQARAAPPRCRPPV